MKPIVAIVGRPNVGKSTFFNRVTKTKDALVDNLPGVTRDRNYGDATWNGVDFTMVDTGGFSERDTDNFAGQIRLQLQQAMDDADVIILILDGKGGVSPYDMDLIKILRNISKPVFYAVNKIDGIEQEDNLYEFYNLGIDNLFPVSSEHGYGIPDFLDELVEKFPVEAPGRSHPEEELISLAVVGRPNVGKSSLINRILGQERLLVSDVPGTTRDLLEGWAALEDYPVVFTDSAGIRPLAGLESVEEEGLFSAIREVDTTDTFGPYLVGKHGLRDREKVHFLKETGVEGEHEDASHAQLPGLLEAEVHQPSTDPLLAGFLADDQRPDLSEVFPGRVQGATAEKLPLIVDVDLKIPDRIVQFSERSRQQLSFSCGDFERFVDLGDFVHARFANHRNSLSAFTCSISRACSRVFFVILMPPSILAISFSRSAFSTL